jgi:hypothetical protein
MKTAFPFKRRFLLLERSGDQMLNVIGSFFGDRSSSSVLKFGFWTLTLANSLSKFRVLAFFCSGEAVPAPRFSLFKSGYYFRTLMLCCTAMCGTPSNPG